MLGKFLLNVVEVAAGIAVFEGVKYVADPVKRAEIKLQAETAKAKFEMLRAQRAATKAGVEV